MSLFHKSIRALALVTLLISSAAAQTCYYPDGSESGHLACSSSGSEASCCRESDVCMTNGLCFGDGIVSRGSCTDKDWNSQECSQYCSGVAISSSIAVTACTNDGEDSQFMCGMNATNCKKNSTLFTLSSSDLTFRTSELDAIVEPAVNSAVSSALALATTQPAVVTRVTVTALPTSHSDEIYTPGQMAGLGVGLGIPLLIASGIALMLWKKDQARTPKLMYPLPDDLADPYTSKDGRPLHPGIVSARPPASRDGSVMSFNTMNAGTPAHLQTFAERYQVMKGTQGFQLQRVELDASPAGDYDGDHELHDLKVPLPKEF